MDDVCRAASRHEREQLSHEIHDTLAQDLIGLVLALEAACEHAPAEATELRRDLGAAREVARESLAKARRLAWASRPGADAPLSEALEGIVRAWSKQAGIRAVFMATGRPAGLENDAEALFLAATREALANVRKHASAAEVRVTLSFMQDVLALDVHDDGVGIEAPRQSPAVARGGFGLPALEDRTRRLGGELTIESEPGGGTTLSIRLPRAPGERKALP
jgi:signal transduction histidine kinase